MSLAFISCCLVLVCASLVAAQCDQFEVCLKEGESNCNINGKTCAAGLYCKLASGTNDPDTGDLIGTCTRAARLAESCSRENSVDNKPCYDPEWNALSCYDPLFDGNGTCVYQSVARGGEPCFASDANYHNGGCVSSSNCNGGFCDTAVALNDVGCNSNTDCGVKAYCRFVTGGGPGNNNVCQTRLALNQNCSSDRQCDPRYICSNLGSRSYSSCVNPFSRVEGQPCANIWDCAENLYCSNDGICRKPSSYKKDFCNDDTDCQAGWLCECITKTKGNKVIDVGAKCTQSEAITKEFIDKFNKYQACAQTNGCADWWVLNGGTNSFSLGNIFAPDTCVVNCLNEAGVDLGFSVVDEGKCFNSAGALFPLVALLIASLLVVFNY